jgi:hypothetical protein
MTTKKLPTNRRAVLVGAMAIIAFTAATQKQIHPPSGSGGPVVIAVVADGYTAADETEFELDAANFIHHSLLADTEYFAGKSGEMRIDTYFEPVGATGASKYGYSVGAANECGLAWTSSTFGLLQQTVGTASNPDHFIVIGNHPFYLGCASGEWTYVARGGFGTDVLLHEFGHVIGKLFDEFDFAANAAKTYPDVIPSSDTRNCATDLVSPHWNGLAGAQTIPGCDHYPLGIIRAFAQCRMGRPHHQKFCTVCTNHLEGRFEYFRNPELWNPEVPTAPTNLRIIKAAFVEQPTPAPPPPPTGQPIMRLIVEFNPVTRALMPKAATFVTARHVPSYERFGDYVYEVSEGDTVFEVGVLPRQLFEVRSYQGGAQAHATLPSQTADIVIRAPGVDVKTMTDPSRAVKVVIYRLLPSVTNRIINRQVLAALKADKRAVPVAELGAEAIRKVL